MTAANVIEAIAWVSSQVDSIAKEKTANAGGTFKYRGIEDVLNALHDPLAQAGVVIVPRVTRADVVKHEVVRSSGKVALDFEAQLLIEYRIYGPGGHEDFIDAAVFATGFDTGDKGTGKAMSYAYKQLAFQLFCIPTDAAEDNEASHVERQPTPPTPPWDEARWKRLAARLKALPDKAKDKVIADLTGYGLFKDRRPVTPFDGRALDSIEALIGAAETVTPTEDHSPHAIEVMADATGIDDPLNPPEGKTLEPWMWELAEIKSEDLDAHDWKVTARAMKVRQAPLVERAFRVAEKLGEPAPDGISDIHGATAVELRNDLLRDPAPF